MNELQAQELETPEVTSQVLSEEATDEMSADVNSAQNDSHKKRAKPDKPVRAFPQYSIREAIKVPKIIGAQNAGNPWAVEHIATALDTSKGANSFFYLTSASRDYGFTIGTSRARAIELTALGWKLAFPESADDEAQAIIEGFNNIELFKNVYNYYQGASLPDDKYLCNTLRESFGVDTAYLQEFVAIFKSNLEQIQPNKMQRKTTSGIPFSTDLLSVSTDSVGRETNDELFVIMPFSEKTDDYPKGYFEEVYSSLLVPAAAEAGLTAKTAKRSGSDIIHSTIVSDIYNAQIVLADLTEHNPNVLFELGLAIAFKKRVVLIRAKGTPAIFDVDNLMRVYDYDRNLWKSTIERDVPNLSKHIQATLQTEGTMYLDILLKK